MEVYILNIITFSETILLLLLFPRYLIRKTDEIYGNTHGVYLLIVIIEVFQTIFLRSLDQRSALQHINSVAR